MPKSPNAIYVGDRVLIDYPDKVGTIVSVPSGSSHPFLWGVQPDGELPFEIRRDEFTWPYEVNDEQSKIH